MSDNQYKSFFDEIQEKFYFSIENYNSYGLGTGCLKCRLIPKQINQICPLCGYGKTYVHEHKLREIHGGVFNGVPVIYLLDQLRHACPICDGTFVDTYDCLRWRHGVADEAENYIITMLGSMPMSLIADHLGLSVQTIANRAEEYACEEMEIMLNCRYRYLSMDELYVGHKKDGSHRIYWILNDNSLPWKSNNIMISLGRTKEDVVENLKKLKHGNEVIAVSTDMWVPYKDAIILVFPNAIVVIDRFHVMEHAEKVINDVRKKVDCPKNIKDDMKKDTQLFLKYWMKLSTDELARLDYYLSYDKKLEEVYYLVQEFMDFYNQRDYDLALEYICKWESKLFSSNVIEELRPLYDTLLNWFPYIMNYFLHRISNGRTEGKNNLLRQIDRMGFHYGLDCLQACIYSHDRNQELVKWRRYQHKIELKMLIKTKALNDAATTDIENIIAA